MSPQSWVVLDINPEPWTSPEVNIGRKGGKIVPIVYKREQVRQYQEALHDHIKATYNPEPLTCDLELYLYFWRQLDKPNSKLVDATNLMKSTEDALHGLLFENDVHCKRTLTHIVEQGVDVRPTIVIMWQPLRDHPDADHWKRQRVTLLDQTYAAPTPDNSHLTDPDRFF